MSSSPNSNASSSDLYSPSDSPALVATYPSRNISSVHSEGYAAGDNHVVHLSGHPNDQLKEASPVDGQDPGQEDARESNHATTLPNGRGHDILHKRKRDEDEGSTQGLQGQPSSSAFSRGTQVLDQTVNPSLNNVSGHPKKRQLLPEDWSKIKQSDAQEGSRQPVGIDDHSRSPSLPDEIWQHIFSFVPPVFLGRLLNVNRTFLSCLTKATGEQALQTYQKRNAIEPVDANAVWASSRKRFAPGLPKPLLGLKELDMWRLLRGRQCQLCGESKNQNFATSSESPLESGPGDKGIRVIWPFGIRACGACLQQCSEKVITRIIRATRKSTILC